jgi:hypothetical protein
MAIGGTGHLRHVVRHLRREARGKKEDLRWITDTCRRAGIALVGCAMTTAGVVAVVAGAGTATKATVEAILRRRIESQLKEKSASELIALTRRLT